MPTFKSGPGIDDLLASLVDDAARMEGTPNVRLTAIENKVCVFCQAPATTFKDALSEKEFTISGTCQKCQDDIFG